MRKMCSISENSVSSGLQIDSPMQQCDTLPEEDYQVMESEPSCSEVCLPLTQSPDPEASIFTTDRRLCEEEKPCQQFVDKSCLPQPPLSPAKSNPISLKRGLNKLTMFLLGFCLPIGGSFCQGSSNDQCKPIMVCLPGQPHIAEDKCKKEEEEIKPVGLITRNKEADFIGGRFIYGCTCGRKNGLQGECPRLSCQNNPGCSMNPPRCWPQFKEPVKPVPPPDQKMICVPIQLVYYDPANS